MLGKQFIGRAAPSASCWECDIAVWRDIRYVKDILGNGIRPGLRDTKEDSDTYDHLVLSVKTRNTSDNI